MYDPIQLSPYGEFFIALCQINEHSYITFGMRTGDKVEVLASFGKVFDESALGLSFVFWNTAAYVRNESFMFAENREREVKYKAYAITYHHYLAFLHHIKRLSLQHNSGLRAYCPDPDQPSRLVWKLVANVKTNAKNTDSMDLNEYGRVGLINNTCRHSAIHLTKQAAHRTDLGKGISSLFFSTPPLAADFLAGKVKKSTPYFYILPLPPQAFPGLTPAKHKIINQLYRRLDEIVLCAQKNPITIQKFHKIKELYNELTRNSKASIFDIMKGIEAWEHDNKDLISKHRKSHWFSFQTATEKMFVNFHHEFAVLRDELVESHFPNVGNN